MDVFNCELCHKSFSRKYNLNRHTQTKCGKENVLEDNNVIEDNKDNIYGYELKDNVDDKLMLDLLVAK